MTKVKMFRFKNRDPREGHVEDQINEFLESNPKIKIVNIIFGGLIQSPIGDEKKTESYYLLVYEEATEIAK